MNKHNPAIVAGILTTHLRQAYPDRNFKVQSVDAGWSGRPTARVYFVVSENNISLAASEFVGMTNSITKIVQGAIKDFKSQPEFLNPTLGEDLELVKQILAEEFPEHQFVPALMTPQADNCRLILFDYELKYVVEITGKNPDNVSSTARFGVATDEPLKQTRARIVEECNAILGKPFE